MEGRPRKKVTLLIAAIALTIGLVNAQEVNLKTATETYNSGATIINEDPVKAAQLFEKCIEMCDEIGDEAYDLRLKAERPLPGLYYKIAMDKYGDKKYEEALKLFEKAYDLALLVEDVTTEQRAQARIPMAYLGMGNAYLQDKNYEQAIESYNKALGADPNNESAYYYMTIAYIQSDNLTKALEAADNAISKDKTGPKKTAKKTQKLITNVLLKQGQTFYKAKNWDEAVVKFEESFKYSPEDPAVSYLIAMAYFNNQKFNEAIASAEKTIEWEKGGDAANAKTYYLLGQIYQKMNDKEKACDAFKKAAIGDFKQNADYQIVHVLKCN